VNLLRSTNLEVLEFGATLNDVDHGTTVDLFQTVEVYHHNGERLDEGGDVGGSEEGAVRRRGGCYTEGASQWAVRVEVGRYSAVESCSGGIESGVGELAKASFGGNLVGFIVDEADDVDDEFERQVGELGMLDGR